ncbi:hypothetical protein KEH51_28760 [[Brevibacterium] frigoritolerans]|uniref:Uncharacterized protein n=1 Tax=Peribacillus frigoritolerans TaxID=450367 RepID=A0A941FT06_9BACI|nr:hypothetical protein [Peribacillus frigoritolerans]
MNLSNDFYAVIIHSAVIVHPAMVNLPAVIKQRTKSINKKIFANRTSMSDPTTNK